MSWLNHDDVAGQIAGGGLLVDPQRGLQCNTSSVVRTKVLGSKEKRGWYRLYTIPLPSGDELIVGSYGINQGADHGTQKIILRKEDRPRLTTRAGVWQPAHTRSPGVPPSSVTAQRPCCVNSG